MTSLRITGTSFLMPNNHAWAALQAGRTLEFGGYGDWPAALMAGEGGALLWVLCLEDVAAPETAFGAETPEALLGPLLDPLRRRLEAVRAPTVVAWSAWRPDSPLRAARAPTPWRRLGRALGDALGTLAANHPALHLVELDEVFARTGRDACFDARNHYFARCRLSVAGTRLLAGAVAAVLDRIATAPKKVLVLDCDNTLWGGVVGEAGVGGLALGQDGLGAAFTDFQRAARRLAGEGVLLALASKNDEADVWAVFDGHPGMVLKRSDITAWRVNWNEKADNLEALARDLDLGLDSFVFWDDNPLEREKMALRLPQALTVEPPADVLAWPRLLDGLDAFARFSVGAEDRRKTEQYRGRAAFVADRRAAADEAGFLRSIALEPSALPLGAGTLARAAQLCAKTNQFNLRAVRHGEADLAALAALAGDGAFAVGLRDRFGDHGTVGLVVARPTADEEVAFLDTFLLSCRVLGRHLEAWMLGVLAGRLRARGARWLVAEFMPSGRNGMAGDFLSGHGLLSLTAPPQPEWARALAATEGLTAGGARFVADLETLSIPHLDVFADAQPLPADPA